MAGSVLQYAGPRQWSELPVSAQASRQHAGGHADGPDWPFFLDFAARHLKWG